MKKIEPLNPMPDGTCRTLKYQYQKNGIANFIRVGSFAATGVIEIEYECETKNEEIMLYEIWEEGFRVSGETGGKARKLGEQEAMSFEDACDLFVESHPQYKDCYSKTKYEQPSYWGCRWFDNEADARKSFG